MEKILLQSILSSAPLALAMGFFILNFELIILNSERSDVTVVKPGTCFRDNLAWYPEFESFILNWYRTHLKSLRSCKPLHHEPDEAKIELSRRIR